MKKALSSVCRYKQSRTMGHGIDGPYYQPNHHSLPLSLKPLRYLNCRTKAFILTSMASFILLTFHSASSRPRHFNSHSNNENDISLRTKTSSSAESLLLLPETINT